MCRLPDTGPSSRKGAYAALKRAMTVRDGHYDQAQEIRLNERQRSEVSG
jgi:hypothetical protein